MIHVHIEQKFICWPREKIDKPFYAVWFTYHAVFSLLRPNLVHWCSNNIHLIILNCYLWCQLFWCRFEEEGLSIYVFVIILYDIINLQKMSVPHQLVSYITFRICICHKERLLTDCINMNTNLKRGRLYIRGHVVA